MQHVTRELKLALIVGFSLVLVVMVLVSDHLSKARKAELAPPANEIALANKIGTPQANALNPSDGSATLNPNAIADPLAMNTPTSGGGTDALNQPVEIRQGGTIENQQLSLEEAAKKLGMATKEGNGTAMIGVEPTLIKSNDLYPPSAISNAPSGVTPLGDSGAPAPLSPTKYAPTEGVKLGVTPSPLDSMKKEVAAASTDKMHKVESGESLYAIAKHYYGNGKYWKQLLEYNKGSLKSENALKLGMKIKVPDLAVLTGKPSDTAVTTMVDPKIEPAKPVASKTVTSKGKTYVVQKGDTPGAIAQKALGTSKRARELMDLNKITNDGGLKIGMVLQLPE